MAKRERVRGVSASELKERLRELVKVIVDSDDYTVAAADEAIATLSALKHLKSPDSLDDFPLPPEFRCPISTQLMTDPVILSTGQVRLFPLFNFSFFFFFFLFLFCCL